MSGTKKGGDPVTIGLFYVLCFVFVFVFVFLQIVALALAGRKLCPAEYHIAQR